MNSFIRSDGAIAADFTNYHWTRRNVQLVRDPVALRSLFEGIRTVFTVGHVIRTRLEFATVGHMPQELWDHVASFFHRDWFHVVSFLICITCLVLSRNNKISSSHDIVNPRSCQPRAQLYIYIRQLFLRVAMGIGKTSMNPTWTMA